MSDPATQPLFGETRRQDKVINVVVATITAFFVTVTVILSIINSVFRKNKCAFLSAHQSGFCVYPMDIVFAIVILLMLVPQVFVVMWYRRGELEPKFRRMIYYNAVVTVLLCITAMFYFFDVGLDLDKCHQHRNNSKISLKQ